MRLGDILIEDQLFYGLCKADKKGGCPCMCPGFTAENIGAFSGAWIGSAERKGMGKYNVLDLFAGVGGLSYGFSRLPEFRILAANEIERDIAVAYALNYPDVQMINCDIREFCEQKLRDVLGKNRIDVVLGGPPCQSYSTLGKRKLDERANLFLRYKRVLQVLNPRAFVFENVTGILSMAKGRLFEQIKEEFEALGYHLCHKVLNALEYGVPPQRERVFLVGMRGHNNFRYPTPTHGEGKKPF